jgi:hypothetical protein
MTVNLYLHTNDIMQIFKSIVLYIYREGKQEIVCVFLTKYYKVENDDYLKKFRKFRTHFIIQSLPAIFLLLKYSIYLRDNDWVLK